MMAAGGKIDARFTTGLWSNAMAMDLAEHRFPDPARQVGRDRRPRHCQDRGRRGRGRRRLPRRSRHGLRARSRCDVGRGLRARLRRIARPWRDRALAHGAPHPAHRRRPGVLRGARNPRDLALPDLGRGGLLRALGRPPRRRAPAAGPPHKARHRRLGHWRERSGVRQPARCARDRVPHLGVVRAERHDRHPRHARGRHRHGAPAEPGDAHPGVERADPVHGLRDRQHRLPRAVRGHRDLHREESRLELGGNSHAHGDSLSCRLSPGLERGHALSRRTAYLHLPGERHDCLLRRHPRAPAGPRARGG